MPPKRTEVLEIIKKNEKEINALIFFKLFNKIYLLGDCQWEQFWKSLPEQSTLRWEALLSALIEWQGREREI
jgi:hypothetical protein